MLEIPTLQDHLAGGLRLGAPDVRGPLAVFPVFGPPPRLEYGHGTAVVKELQEGASVRDLLVFNPGSLGVLLYEGEQVLGAQQNRTFDVSVLVPAGASVRVPVSCVEHGRWDGSRHAEPFRQAPQAAYPSLRAMKQRVAAEQLAAGQAPRASQSAVWDEVAAKSARLGTASPTAAMHDIYSGTHDRLGALSVPLHKGQTGALAAIGGRFTVLDCVSRAEVFAELHGPLARGYALDALEAAAAPVPTAEDAEAFLGRLQTARLAHHDGIGAGRDVRFAEAGIRGSGVVAGEEELVALTAFAA
jgi:hypothetical protein